MLYQIIQNNKRGHNMNAHGVGVVPSQGVSNDMFMIIMLLMLMNPGMMAGDNTMFMMILMMMMFSGGRMM